MKKLLVLLSAVLLIAALSACAASKTPASMKVKCPACGHDFNYTVPPELR